MQERNPTMKPYTHLIWDFNGTLLNDVAHDIAVTNRLLVKHGLPPFENADAYRAVFGFPVIDYYRRLGFDFSEHPFSELADEWMDDYNRGGNDAALYPDAPEILDRMNRRGVPQVLLSATERGMLLRQLDSLGIRGRFCEILGADNIHAHGKLGLARAWRERNPNAVPLMVGDTDHDAETARAMGADIVLLTCGHQSVRALAAANPLMICGSLSEIPFDRLFPER